MRYLDTATKQTFVGNIFLILCCVFYLIWWFLAFKPVGAIKGMKSGWLLIPAFAAGLVAIILILRGVWAAPKEGLLIPGQYILWGGIAAYVGLLLITVLLFKRPVTTELFLIVGWAMLALEEVNALYATGRFSHQTALVFIAIIIVALIISMASYVLYTRLNSRAGYIDGFIPLLLVALVTAGISCKMI